MIDVHLRRVGAWATFLLVAAPSALAYCPMPEPKICSVFFGSDKVFYGTVNRVEHVGAHGVVTNPDEDWENYRYTVAVREAFKADVAPTETVTSGNDSARWVATVGERRMFYVTQGQVGSLCSPIDEGKNAKRAIAQIRALPDAHGATVEGAIVDTQRPWHPMAGTRITVLGGGRTYTAITNRAGEFRIDVPPGRYRIETSWRDVEPYSRPDTGGFEVVRGQCAQFLLTPSPAPAAASVRSSGK